MGTRNLVRALIDFDDKNLVLVVASGTGYYGDRGDEELEEQANQGNDFFARVWADLERETWPAATAGIRTVSCRTGVVLGHGGGLLPFYINSVCSRFGRLAPGEGPWVPWIHVKDVVGLFLHAGRTSSVIGAMNVVAPNPARYMDLMREISAQLRRPIPVLIPPLYLRARHGQIIEILRSSRRVLPAVAVETGYEFQFPELRSTLNDLLPFRNCDDAQGH